MTRRRQPRGRRDHAADDPLGARFVEVPVNYLPRVGTSSVTGDPIKAAVVGLRMIALVLRLRRSAPRRFKRPPAFTAPTPVTGERADERLPL